MMIAPTSSAIAKATQQRERLVRRPLEPSGRGAGDRGTRAPPVAISRLRRRAVAEHAAPDLLGAARPARTRP